jgi:outer membrane protein
MSFSRASLASMSPALKPLVGALVLAFGAAGAQAQSLTEVVNAARSYDATYLGARSSADAAHYRYEQSRAAHLPTANLQIQAARQGSVTPTVIEVSAPTPTNPDGVATVPTTETTFSNSAGATVTASQTIYNRQNDIAIDQAQKLEDAAQSQLAQAEQDLIVRVAQAYFNVLAAADALQSVEGNSKAIAEQLASAKRNFEVGNATITDTREAEARADLARSQQISAENDLLVAKVTLDQLVGRNGVMPHPLTLPAMLPPVMPSQASDWVMLAESDNPGIKQAQLALDVAELETARAKAGHLPTLVAGASYGRNRQKDSFSPGGGSLTGTGANTSLALTLNVPLFAGFSIQNRVRETVALEQKARTDAEGIHNSVVLGARTAFLGALTQRAQVQALEAAESSSRLALDATVLGYKVGVKVNLDVLNAQSQLYSTQRDAAGARYQYLVSTLKLRQAAGNLTSNDLLPIDALLVK